MGTGVPWWYAIGYRVRQEDKVSQNEDEKEIKEGWVPFTITVPRDVLNRLEIFAEQNSLRRSEAARMLLRKGLELLAPAPEIEKT